MHGVTTFCDSAVVVRGRIKTLPGSQWAAGRAYNEIIKKVFDERGIEMPYPHRTIYWGEDKHGEVSPLRIMKERAEEEGEAPALKPSRSEEHTSELQSLMRISYAVFCLKKKKSASKPAYSQHRRDATNTYATR